MGYKIDDFKLDLRKSVSPSNHIWVNSGYSTSAPLPNTVMGVKGCFSPPFAAGDTSLELEIIANNHIITDTGSKGKGDCGLLFSCAEWRPDKIVRKGTYNYKVDGNLISLYVISELIPLTGKSGFMSKVIIKNRDKSNLEIRVRPIISAGHPIVMPLNNWGFVPPAATSESAEVAKENVWENSKVRVTLLYNDHIDILQAGEIFECSYAVVFSESKIGVSYLYDPNLWEMQTSEVWEKRIELANKKIPMLKSDVPGLEEYYIRSLISGLVCLWENEAYSISPFPATSGMDGGSICCYPWDSAGYSAPTIVRLMEDKSIELIKLMLHSGIDSHISMALDGSGVGECSYSYSMWSIINFYWVVVTDLGKGFELLDDIIKLFQAEELRLQEWKNLKNYGEQHNLLEMRSCGYEYYVPSPNAERAWCYDRLADIADHIGRKGLETFRNKAEAIRESIRENLWDESKGWFRCIHPDEHIETVYSIQIFDVLKMGVCSEDMKIAMLKHLKEGAFLGKYGISSVSSEDEIHYELNDPDWSGAGCYTGDGPNLAQTLWENNEPQLAWDILKRFFWMGEMLPYYPQEHYCDKPMVPEHKRANIIAGITGVQAILFGMVGIKLTLDHKLIINPQPPKDGTINIKGFNFNDSIIDILMKTDYIEIKVDNKIIYEGIPTKIVL